VKRDHLEDIYRLTPIQEGMLFHALHAEVPGVYLQQFAYAVVGELDGAAFVRAFQEAVDRHPVLRSGFVWERAGRPLQVVVRRAELPAATERWGAATPEEAERELAVLFREDQRRGLDLARPPLLRLTLLETGGRVGYLLWTYHHLILDGWSMALVLDEVLARYRALTGGPPFERRPPRPFRDYVAWLERQDLAAAEAYWRRALQGIEEVTPLPAREVAGRVEESGGGKRTLFLSAAVRASLEERAQRSGLTLNTLAQAAWALLFARLGNLDEVVFGTVVSGRPAELEGVEVMVGMFINTLLTRVRVPARQEVGEWLRAIQSDQMEMRRFEHTPLSQIQAWSGIAAGRPLFESILVFENRALFAAEGGEGQALRLRPVEFQGETGYPLVIAVEPGQGLGLTLAYDRLRFDPVTIHRWLEHLGTLLEALAGDPERPVESLSPIAPGERHQLLVEWNDRLRTRTAECLDQRFTALAARLPDAVALEHGSEQVTYGELDRRTDRLAQALRRLGVGPEVLVALLLRRSIGRIEAVYGVLKAGGTYLPLEPEQPVERLGSILADSGASLLLSSAGLADGLAVPGLRNLRLDQVAEAAAAELSTVPDNRVTPENQAYVIYTSGSTGRPQGVMVPHGAIGATLEARQAGIPLGPADQVLDTTSFGFDATLWATFAPLHAGARLVLSLPEGAGATGALGEAVARHRITVLQLPPAWLRHFLEQHLPDPRVALRHIICGGEVLVPELVESFFARFDAGLHNFYGPTEAALDTTAWSCRPGERQRNLPIGRPVANKEVYLFDRHLRPVPTGAAGEMGIAGQGLARGYLRDPALTAARFVPHPWSHEPGARLYRSGDMARFLPDGNLEFLGRTDHQVKVRGYRIELGEIEAALGRHPDVRQTVVTVWEESPGGVKRLAAYVVPRAGCAPAPSELRRFLQQQLPEHMVPAAFVALESFPLSASGKVDRRRLPAPGSARPDLASLFVAPRDERERTLAGIWSAVLGVAQVGVHDNFFELGGDSILSLQIAARARQAGIALTTRELFAHQTLAELAAALAGEPAGEAPVDAGPEAVSGEVPLTPIQRWFFEHVQVDRHHWNQAVMVTVRRPFPPAVVERAVDALLAHHDALRLRFVGREGEVRQLYSGTGGATPWTHLAFAGLPPERRRAALEAAAADLQLSLDPAHGPLLRAASLSLDESEPARLLLVVHHLAVDGVSWRLLLEDLSLACGQLARGEAPRLPAKTSSFKRWAERLHEHAQTSAVAAELGFWLAPSGIEPLPRDHPAGCNLESRRQTVRVALSAVETEGLLRELPRAYNTRIEDVLLTAVLLAFRAWTGRPRLLLDLEGHGREGLFADVDLSRTVGWFTSEYPVLLEWAGEGDEVQALRAVREQLRRIPQRGIGYGLLRYLHADPEVGDRLRALPRAEVVFNYLGQFASGRAGDSPWGPAREATGPPRSPRGERLYLFELNGSVADGRLCFDLSYSAEIHQLATAERLAGSFLAGLRRLIERAAVGGGLVPADFPLARADQATLDRLAAAGHQVEDLYPLSPMQQGMLFDSLHADGGAYVMQVAGVLRGELDTAALAAAWRQMVERHPVLRTAFVWEGCDQPLQAVLRAVLPALAGVAEEDWRGLTEAEQERRLEHLRAARRQSCDLTRAPLVRLDLLRLADRAWRLLWSSHHLVLDGWSTPMLFAELLALYRALRRGEKADLLPRRPFRDYIAWLAARDLTAAERYFRGTLGGYAGASPLEPLLLPEERRKQGERYAAVRALLPRQQTADLHGFARRHHLTLSTVVQGAWALLLARLGGSPDVVFGVTVSGRPATLLGVEEMIGMFINTLPVRLQAGRDVTLVPWLRAHQERQAELPEHEHTPLAKIQQWCQTPAGAALFESIVVFENYPEPARTGEGSGLESGGFQYWIRETFPLILDVGPAAELSLRLKYDEGLYQTAALADALTDLEALLGQFVATPEAPLASFLGLLDTRASARQEARRQELRESRFEGLQRAARRRGEPAAAGARGAGEGDGA
jgi:amino acid adenylation domain-containing protein/non-ribosomal peptide synthase protein (TIGR01720 family)